MLIWSLILALTIVAYALLIILLLPKFILKSHYPIANPTDRGLKKYKFNDSDYAIVYEPSLSARKYITQYVLAKKDGKKTIKCKIAPNVTYIDFDIVLFNAQGTCFHAINSKDILGTDRMTSETDLPAETAYASLLVNRVNETQLRKEHANAVSVPKLVGFGLAALLLSVGMAVVVMYAFSNIFGGLFRESFAEKMLSGGWVFILPTVICAVCIAAACYTLFSRNSKR